MKWWSVSPWFEECVGVTHLGHFLLANILLPDLVKVGRCRLTPA
jgi:hypothetical protein